jgi:polyhydroxybutyrate depolymerase
MIKPRASMTNVITSTTISTTINITVGGVARSFIAYIPAGTLQDCGVLVMLHGGSGSGPTFKSSMNMDPIAKTNKFVVLWPTAIDGNWTDGRIATQGGPDDIKFIRQMITYMNTTYGTSATKVFGSGISNGAIFLHWVVANNPGVFLGIAPVAGNIPDTFSALCTHNTPVIMFNGTADPLMPFAGGVGGGAFGNSTDTMMSSYNSIAKYATLNKAKAFIETILPIIVADGTTVTKREYPGGTVAPTILYVITGGGHTWPGGPNAGTTQPVVGKVTSQINASQTIVDTFKPLGLSTI